jgi:iron complex outermembrane receptor protein
MTVIDNSTDEDANFGQLLPSVAATWKVREDTAIYGSIAKGYKAGGFNLAAPANQIAFDPEENWSFEVGVKSALADGAVDLRFAAFFIDWEDMQLSLFDPVAGGYVTNAGASESFGVEAEANTQVTELLSLFGTIGTADTEFKEFIDPYGNDVAGKSLPFAPEYTFSLGAQLAGDLTRNTDWFARAEWVGVGDFYYDANNTESESYDLVNLRAGFEREGWTLAFWVRNLFDTAYFPVAFQPDPSNEAVFVANTGEPLVGGVTLRASF